MLKDIVVENHLSDRQRIILRDLVDRTYCSYNRLVEQVLEPIIDANDAIRRNVRHIRRNLLPGWRIVLLWGHGFRFERETNE